MEKRSRDATARLRFWRLEMRDIADEIAKAADRFGIDAATLREYGTSAGRLTTLKVARQLSDMLPSDFPIGGFDNAERILTENAETLRRASNASPAATNYLSMALLIAETAEDAAAEHSPWLARRAREFLGAALLMESDMPVTWFEELGGLIVSAVGRSGADAKHGQPGGSREKREAIRAIWASGKYSARSICAEQECAALDMSPDTARKALRNTPDPDPWPAKIPRAR